MADYSDLIELKNLMIKRYPRFATQIANANLYFSDNLRYHTASTDGKNIYFDPNFLDSLSTNDKLFIIAHELMHVKFQHMFRLKNPDGTNKDITLWNIATDAIINANLELDGFTIPQNAINEKEALNYSAEEYYNILLEREKQKNQNQNLDRDNTLKNCPPFALPIDDHSLWEDIFKMKERKKDKNKKKPNHQPPDCENEDKIIIDEKTEFNENRQERKEKAKKNLVKLKNQVVDGPEGNKVSYGKVGSSAPALDWKTILRQEINKNQIIWSQRRSIKENNFAYRLTSFDTPNNALSEIMIDVSGSVDDDLVKSFLRQLKPLLIHTKIKVGFFASYATKQKDFIEIKNNSDIDNLQITRPGCCTDFDCAVKAFSKNNKTNKIVFTDGYPGTMPGNDTKNINCIWIVYGNKDFKPCCGKVIQVDEKKLARKETSFQKTNNP